MKKMNVKFKSLLGFGFFLAFMVLGTLNTNAQSDFVNGQLDAVNNAAATKDAAAINAFAFTGVTFISASEAKQALTDAVNQLADDLNDDSDVVQNQAYVTGSFYRNVINGINTSGNVPNSIIESFVQLEAAASNNPFSDFIIPMDIFNDTVTMLSN
ncbi:MAG: hypothetical protein NXI23_12200 [Bacteroidetes bacterium]|jgi:hypothetical protein|nr:hypothetical protein [Bacteroidota bacterium]MDF1864821.1 hypothetical protein [Saprospiraceae bacterium]